MSTRPLDVFLGALRRHGCEPRAFGEGWIARCPGPDHEPGDGNRALYVGVAADGCVLAHCFGTVDAEDVLRERGEAQQ